MIEVICDETEQKEARQIPVKLPKNLRQIGEGTNDTKIYIEDFVITYIRKLAGKEYKSKIAELKKCMIGAGVNNVEQRIAKLNQFTKAGNVLEHLGVAQGGRSLFPLRCGLHFDGHAVLLQLHHGLVFVRVHLTGGVAELPGNNDDVAGKIDEIGCFHNLYPPLMIGKNSDVAVAAVSSALSSPAKSSL